MTLVSNSERVSYASDKKNRKSCLKPFLSLTSVGFYAVPVINVGQRLKVVAGAIKCSI